MKTKTIDVNACEWIDKVNGNSYFCGTVTLNYGMKGEETFLMPFQYGYGSQYEHEAKAILTQFNKISTENESLYTYCKRMGVKLNENIVRDCKQRELKQIEIDYNRNLETA
jgi:hypothetical protein|tara:strand:- start:84 stop:416 length:333 start_codon:yes stop_codon:yes gene_type:complete